MIKIKKLTYDLNGHDETIYRLLDKKECCIDLSLCINKLNKDGAHDEMALIVYLDFGTPKIIRLEEHNGKVWFELNKNTSYVPKWVKMSHCPFCGKSLDTEIVESIRLIKTTGYHQIDMMLEPGEKLPSWLEKGE